MARRMTGAIPRVPFVGRLYLTEYLVLMFSFIFIGLEAFVRMFTLAMPETVISILYKASVSIFNLFSTPASINSRNKNKSITSPVSKASTFPELCEIYGYYAEEHVIQTADGYLLGVHRLAWRKNEEDQRVNSGSGSVQKKVVYMHHGLMMNSEVWVCLSEQDRCLPFVLVEAGYDVWLGNNRGNKYSKKSVHTSPASPSFWDFSIDEFAFHDIPDTIKYILEATRRKSLAYVGFSQGTAQAFATLSIHPHLNDQIDVFIALAPAMSPPNLSLGIVSSLIKASPEVLFLAFGRKAILSSTTMWEALLYPALYVSIIDKALSFLFGWKTNNITTSQKLAAYPHLFSYTSTKSVVHWFQIIRNGVFQMYDDEVQKPFSIGSKHYKVAKFPTRNIKTPIVLLYGGSDSLVDIHVMLKELPRHTISIEVPAYEHLDFLWASDVHRTVIPHVVDALEAHAGRTVKMVDENGSIRSFLSPSLPTYSDTEADGVSPASPQAVPALNAALETPDTISIDENDSSTVPERAERRRTFKAGHSPHPSVPTGQNKDLHASARNAAAKQNGNTNGRPGSSASHHSPAVPASAFGAHGISLSKTAPATGLVSLETTKGAIDIKNKAKA